MSLTTTFDERLKNMPTGHEQLDDALYEARRCTGVDWQVKRMVLTKRSIWPWKKDVMTTLYQLIYPVSGFPSWRVITVASGNGDVFGVGAAECIIAYLWGAIGEACARSGSVT